MQVGCVSHSPAEAKVSDLAPRSYRTWYGAGGPTPDPLLLDYWIVMKVIQDWDKTIQLL